MPPTDRRGHLSAVAGEPFDPWTAVDDEATFGIATPVQGNYNADDFYCRSVNKHDHSSNMQVKMPVEYTGLLAAIVQSGRIPEYRSTQDVVRDAIVHRLHYLAAATFPELRAVVEIQKSIAQMEQAAQQNAVVEQMIAMRKEQIARAVEADDHVTLDEAYQGAMRDAQHVPARYVEHVLEAAAKAKRALDGPGAK